MSKTPHRAEQQAKTEPRTAAKQTSPKAQLQCVQIKEIPAALKKNPNWVHWKLEQDGKRKQAKVPYIAGSEKKAATDSPSSWRSYDDAVALIDASRGLGFVLPQSGELFFIDIDNAIDLQTGEMLPWVKRLVEQLNTFTEISPSGTGVHVYGRVKGTVPREGLKKRSIEFYTTGRFATVTGKRLASTPPVLKEVDVTWLYKFVQADVFTFHNDTKYEALFKTVGEEWRTLGYSSHSEADIALCGFLAKRLDNDIDEIDRAFRLSGLMREKWDEQRGDSTYGRNTIVEAVQFPASSYQDTDLGNAERFVAQHGADIRFSHSSNEWLLWDGMRYAVDRTGGIERKAKAFVKSTYAQAAKPSKSSVSIQWAEKSASFNHLNSIIRFARTEPEISVTTDKLDVNPWLLNCRNGTIDLRSGKLGEHRREDLITRLVPVEYHPDAKCPIWEQHLHKIMGGNAELISFIQRTVGYSLTGDTSEHKVFILHGGGANGKTKLVETIRKLFGDYVRTAEGNLLLQRKSEGPRNDIARLAGARLVLTSETGEEGRFDEAQVKRLTGEDRLVARRLFQEFEEFEATGKIWLTTNKKPRIQGRDFAIWRRIMLIPFNVTIPDDEQDKHFGDKLAAELTGILAWAIKGCLEWQKIGLCPPATVLAATKEYEQESDELRDFLEDCSIVEKNNHSRTVPCANLFKAYQEHSARNGQKETWNSAYFGKQLSERGFGSVKINGKRCRTGISLKSQKLPKFDKRKWTTSDGATPPKGKPPKQSGSASEPERGKNAS